MMIKNTFIFTLFILSVFLLLACEEDTVQTFDGPCGGRKWAEADKNGTTLCFATAEGNLFNNNTPEATVGISFGNIGQNPREVVASFTVGGNNSFEVNTAYPLVSGKVAGADEITSGQVTILTFSRVAGEECMAGTFTLSTQQGTLPGEIIYTNGRFVSYEGSSVEGYNACNPF